LRRLQCCSQQCFTLKRAARKYVHHRVRLGEAPLSKAIGSQQTEETLHKTVHKAVPKMRRITPMHRF
jgi:hypothetical protein